ncbi:MAG TPA: SDR family NAD(P)-dependent oxidoreductase [Thermoanaerobaculia bacterium]|nr:SDR family NAD(P)-dependent oxidoreductase [Thermoanaerobaculia bacterium]
MTLREIDRGAGRVVITGGCGFIGTNLAHRLARDGRPVWLLDNLSRPGVEENLDWLRATHEGDVHFQLGDVRDRAAVERAVAGAQAVFHFAAQVAVTTSVRRPVEDFEINALGTLNVLEALRAREEPPPLVFTSTNKVYGNLDGLELALAGDRYQPVDGFAAHGVGESIGLDFCSPYGCSKGCADQYVRDYARIYGLPAVVFRMSCIYGPHQWGTEDQGWVAHFARHVLDGRPITLYGDGRQVRDVLWVEDLVEAMLLAEEHAGQLAGQAFNIGGGPENAVCLLQVIDRLAALAGERPEVRFDDWRPGDQRYYVSDTRRFQAATGWRPRVGAEEGIERMLSWMSSERPPEPALAGAAPAAAGRQAS